MQLIVFRDFVLTLTIYYHVHREQIRQSRKNMRRAANRMRRRIRNLIDEMHHKIARYLADNFDIILLPTFETSDIVMRGKRKLRKKSVRQMLTLSHYRFKRFLKHKAKENWCYSA